MDWARMLTYITGTVDQELLLRNEYLATEIRILKAQLKGRQLPILRNALQEHLRKAQADSAIETIMKAA